MPSSRYADVWWCAPRFDCRAQLSCHLELLHITQVRRACDVLCVSHTTLAREQDFIYSARAYGKIIISEAFLPDDKKTIRPSAIGGQAGGDKYIVHNILFKFALDRRDFYGSDAYAAKVAGHELQGLISLFNCDEVWRAVRDVCSAVCA
jgi:hypothetical protein